MNEEQSKKNTEENFIENQVKAASLAKELYDKEVGGEFINQDAFSFALQFHTNFNTTGLPISIEDIIKTAKKIKLFLKRV